MLFTIRGEKHLAYKNKKGFVDKIMIVLIIAVVIAIFALIFFAGSLLLPILVGSGSMVIGQISNSVNTNSPNTELANATNTSLGIASNVLGVIELCVYIFMIILTLGFLALCFYVRTYPFLTYIWIFIIILLVFFSMFLSNAYITASQMGELQDFYALWGQNDFIMTNLPMIIAVIGIFGGIFLFILGTRDQESEVQQL